MNTVARDEVESDPKEDYAELFTEFTKLMDDFHIQPHASAEEITSILEEKGIKFIATGIDSTVFAFRGLIFKIYGDVFDMNQGRTSKADKDKLNTYLKNMQEGQRALGGIYFRRLSFFKGVSVQVNPVLGFTQWNDYFVTVSAYIDGYSIQDLSMLSESERSVYLKNRITFKSIEKIYYEIDRIITRVLLRNQVHTEIGPENVKVKITNNKVKFILTDVFKSID